MNDQPIVGDWRFDADSAALTQPGRIIRLEDRTARTLALLCRRRGEVVSKAQILAEVWEGRTVSANSVAIVIADLRRALGESSRAPGHIETVGKRGYRLRAAPDDAASDTPSGPLARTKVDNGRRAIWTAGVVAAAAVILFVLLLQVIQPAPVVTLVLGPVRNDTGDSGYDPLAKALTELVQERSSRMLGVVATDATSRPPRDPKGRQLEMRSRLILWNNTPTLSLAAVDRSDGRIVWSGMAVGEPDDIASAAMVELVDFEQHTPKFFSRF